MTIGLRGGLRLGDIGDWSFTGHCVIGHWSFILVIGHLYWSLVIYLWVRWTLRLSSTAPFSWTGMVSLTASWCATGSLIRRRVWRNLRFCREWPRLAGCSRALGFILSWPPTNQTWGAARWRVRL